MASVKMDSKCFSRRLDLLYKSWNDGYSEPNSPWHNIDTVAVVTGKNKKDSIEDKTLSFHLWLLGYEIPELLILLHRKDRQVYFIAAEKKLNIISVVKSLWESDYQGTLTSIPTSDTVALSTLFEQALPQAPLKIATFLKEVHIDKFAEAWEAHLKALSPQPQIVPLHPCLVDITLIKDDTEIENIIHSSKLSVLLHKYILTSHILEILDEERQVSHEAISQQVTDMLDSPTSEFMKKCKEKFQIPIADCDLTFALIQSPTSGYTLKSSAKNSSQNLCLTGGSYIISVSSKCNEYCSCITRTVLINPSPLQKAAYEVVYNIRTYLMEKMLPGASFSSLFKAAQQKLESSTLKGCSFANGRIGHSIGLEFYDGETKITEDSAPGRVLQPNMILHLSLGVFVNDKNVLSANNKEEKPFGIWISDTIRIQSKGGVILTDSKARLSDVIYTLDDEDKGGEEKKGEKQSEKSGDKKRDERREERDRREVEAVEKNVILSTRLRNRAGKSNADEESRKKIEMRQKYLREQRHEELALRVKSGTLIAGNSEIKSVKKYDRYLSYADVSTYPSDMRMNKIYIDELKESVFLPMRNMLTPFHISMIKTVTLQQDDSNKSILKFQFHIPLKYEADTPFVDVRSQSENGIYIKELLFASKDSKSFTLIHKRIKDLMNKVKNDSQVNDAVGPSGEGTLIINKTKNKVILKDLLVRPTLSNSSKKVVGLLEAHTNGFRFQASRNTDTLDIMYSNIRFAFFQAVSNKDPIILIHFYLYQPILIGKKKTHDIQFYSEAGSQTEDLSHLKVRHGENADYLEEEREKQLKKKLNRDFEVFCKNAENLANEANTGGRKFMFDIPIRDLEFSGVPFRSAVSIIPTSTCLVNLIESPWFLVSLDEIEIVSLERLSYGLRNFDMVFIFKDLNKPVKRIDTIPVSKLDVIKVWLTEMNIPYYENPQSLNWTNILKTILADLDNFVADEGFNSFLGTGGPGEGEEGEGESGLEDEEDEDFSGAESDNASEEEDDSESESDYSEDDSEVSGSEGGAGSQEDDDVLDWDELDGEKDDYDDEDD